ncbi:MAG: hypothetical protein DMG36_26995 [Acidobacteria bacterium]|nr:MAG: hypothetical protein DMG36_26995 [Acidobacteriota bacterium]
MPEGRPHRYRYRPKDMAAMAFSGDRRKHKRVPLHWPVRLFRQSGKPLVEVVEGTTENLSTEGLYCITRERFRTGERLQCEIVIPGESFGSPEPFLRLQYHITVKRVEHVHRGLGLGCHIEDYSLTRSQPAI